MTDSMAILVTVLIALAFVGIPVACLEIGYRYGVRETERWWSEAVKRAEAARREAQPRG